MQEMWAEFLRSRGEEMGEDAPISHFHFSDTPDSANELAELARRGIKRATSPSLWWFEETGEPLPQVGDLHVVTNASGEARCVVQTTRVEIVPFDQIDEAYARREGEGNKSLEYWRRVHWPYYHRELEGTGRVPQPDMPIVCEYFECVFPSEPR